MILVTGALGQIGTELVLALQEKYGNDKIIASDLKEPENYHCKFEECDIRDIETFCMQEIRLISYTAFKSGRKCNNMNS